MERVLASGEVKERLGKLAVGLAADCDAPEDGIEGILHEHLPGASTLPFAAFLTEDGVWIDGFSGYKDTADFVQMLAAVEKSPLLEATPAVRKQLEKPAKTATAAAERGDWKVVLGTVREAGKSSGRCEEREAIKAAEKKAREWVAAQFDAVVVAATSGADLAPARKQLAAVKDHFAGEPEAADAEVGRKALIRLTQIRDAEARPNPAKDLREKAAAMFEGARWATIFAKVLAVPGDKSS
ncbi:MAG: hypothetical protein ABIP94_05875 [Planctomycetota bacterium]